MDTASTLVHSLWNQHWLSSDGRDSQIIQGPLWILTIQTRCRLRFYGSSPSDPTMPSYAEQCVPWRSMDFVIVNCFGFDDGGIIIKATSESFFRIRRAGCWNQGVWRRCIVDTTRSSLLRKAFSHACPHWWRYWTIPKRRHHTRCIVNVHCCHCCSDSDVHRDRSCYHRCFSSPMLEASTSKRSVWSCQSDDWMSALYSLMSGCGYEGDCSIQRTCWDWYSQHAHTWMQSTNPKCHVSTVEKGGNRRMPCRQIITVSSQFHWFIQFGARG